MAWTLIESDLRYFRAIGDRSSEASLLTQTCRAPIEAPFCSGLSSSIFSFNFDELTNDNMVLTNRIAAVRSEGGDRWILTQWDQLRRTWGNARCPCLHYDPILDPCEAGKTVSVKGKIWFHQGDSLQTKVLN